MGRAVLSEELSVSRFLVFPCKLGEFSCLLTGLCWVEASANCSSGYAQIVGAGDVSGLVPNLMREKFVGTFLAGMHGSKRSQPGQSEFTVDQVAVPACYVCAAEIA